MTLTPEELRAIDIAAEALQKVARAWGGRRAELYVYADGRVEVGVCDRGGRVDELLGVELADLLVGGPEPMPSVAVGRLAGRT